MATQFLERPGKPRLAYCQSLAADPGKSLPAIVFLGGYRSDMSGTKATWLESQCRARHQAFVRFDYRGHGLSEGTFEDCVISQWMEDAATVIDTLTAGPVILVGSSMGGWISLLIAQQNPERVAGIVGIAAAADYTREIDKNLTAKQKREMNERGFISLPNDYSDKPYIVTKALIDDAEPLCLLDKDNIINAPVRLVHGMKDTDVPWQNSFRIRNAITGGDVDVILIEHGDHRLSTPENLALIDTQIRILSGLAE